VLTLQGRVQFDSVGTRIPDEPKVLKYRNSTVVNNCGETGISNTFNMSPRYIHVHVYMHV